ncbi:MAG TPA: glycosyltransferase family 4 protein [Stellaceae bacterium]|jgi:glycosyltransferase involved in cell wall biosynthesis
MKIAQVCPLYESCPPKLYGGTERIVFYLTEELVRLGHDVTLFASGDSRTSATLEAPCEEALRLNQRCKDPLVYHFTMLHRVYRRRAEFDLIHFHTDYLHFPLFAESWQKTLTTMHGRLDVPDLPVIVRECSMMPLVSISASQRAPLAWANWYGTVQHGLPRDLHRLGDGGGGYLAFLGRVSPEKGLDQAIEIARDVGLPLQVAAKVDPVDRDYFEEAILPLLDDPLIEFVGEIGENEKCRFLGDAVALLFPIDWPEPFGLVLIEAMANGTPVIAFGRGSVPEIIEDGLTGFIVDDLAGAARAVPLAAHLDRGAIRRRFEERFTAERMARDYLALYQRVLHGDTPVKSDPLGDVAAMQPALLRSAGENDFSQAAD